MLTLRKRGTYFHIRGSIRVGRETRVVDEHSTGTDRRETAEAYRSKLESDIRHEILHGRGGRAHVMTISDAGMRYMERPGGVRSYDLWRLDRIASAVGDYSIAQAADAWSHFKRVRCGGLSPATVPRFRATFSAALNCLAAEEGFDAPKLPHGEKVSNKRVKYLTDDQADRLIAAYALHVSRLPPCFVGRAFGSAKRCAPTGDTSIGAPILSSSRRARTASHGPSRCTVRRARRSTAYGCRKAHLPKGRFS